MRDEVKERKKKKYMEGQGERSVGCSFQTERERKTLLQLLQYLVYIYTMHSMQIL